MMSSEINADEGVSDDRRTTEIQALRPDNSAFDLGFSGGSGVIVTCEEMVGAIGYEILEAAGFQDNSNPVTLESPRVPIFGVCGVSAKEERPDDTIRMSPLARPDACDPEEEDDDDEKDTDRIDSFGPVFDSLRNTSD
jgi:hypothetical protein